MRYVWYKDENKVYKLMGDLPESDAYQVFEIPEDIDPRFLTVENGQLKVLPDSEILFIIKEQKLAELRAVVASLLSQTDYIIIKLSEAQTEEEKQMLLQKYQEQLNQRQAIRQWNETMKQRINNATTLQELQEINITYTGE